jgi:hypothetical protein
VYPRHALARIGQDRLGEFLVRMRLLSRGELDDALASQPRGMLLGEYLVQLQKLSEEDLYLALSLHAGIELGAPEIYECTPSAARKLPLAVIRRWKVVPYRIDLGQMHLLTPHLPTEAMTRELVRYCSLELRFRLVRPGEFQLLFEECYGERLTEAPLRA